MDIEWGVTSKGSILEGNAKKKRILRRKIQKFLLVILVKIKSLKSNCGWGLKNYSKQQIIILNKLILIMKF